MSKEFFEACWNEIEPTKASGMPRYEEVGKQRGYSVFLQVETTAWRGYRAWSAMGCPGWRNIRRFRYWFGSGWAILESRVMQASLCQAMQWSRK